MAREVNPIIPALLSLLVMGTGQIFNREIHKGLALLICDIVMMLSFFMFGGSEIQSVFMALINLFVFVIWIYLWVWNVIDAYKGARR
jgi:hypothetical protein